MASTSRNGFLIRIPTCHPEGGKRPFCIVQELASVSGQLSSISLARGPSSEAAEASQDLLAAAVQGGAPQPPSSTGQGGAEASPSKTLLGR